MSVRSSHSQGLSVALDLGWPTAGADECSAAHLQNPADSSQKPKQNPFGRLLLNVHDH
jgi:hypothetical protein